MPWRKVGDGLTSSVEMPEWMSAGTGSIVRSWRAGA